MNFPIIDLHCDLLYYLQEHHQRTPYDSGARCSIPQLRQGHVKLQVMALFTRTALDSLQKGVNQMRIYHDLPKKYPLDFAYYSSDWDFQDPRIAILMAFENASGFCGENEELQEGIKRLNLYISQVGKPLYISLTWNSENRFGGGAHSEKGLKPDGKHLLEEINKKGIAIDLSHASDALAYEIIEYIEGQNLEIPLMASHSNARAVTSVSRNLPDEIAKEIFRRQGVVGLNLYHQFLGESEEGLLNHIGHWLELGGENCIALGSDFFYEGDFPSVLSLGKVPFFKNFQDASCYGSLLHFIQKELGLNDGVIEKLAFKNCAKFIGRNEVD